MKIIIVLSLFFFSPYIAGNDKPVDSAEHSVAESSIIPQEGVDYSRAVSLANDASGEPHSKMQNGYNPMEPISELGYNHFGVADIDQLCVVINDAISRGEEEINILNIGSFSWLSLITSFLNENYPDVKFNLYGITSSDHVSFPFCGYNCLINSLYSNTFVYSEENCSVKLLATFRFSESEIDALPEFHFIMSNGALHYFDNPEYLFTRFYCRLFVNGVFMTLGFAFALINHDDQNNFYENVNKKLSNLFMFLCNPGWDFLMVNRCFPNSENQACWNFCVRKNV